MKERWVTATEFKAKCLALLDEVEERGETLTITKRGRPVATVGPAKRKRWRSPEGILAGKVEIVGDIVNFSTAHLWNALRNSAGEGHARKVSSPRQTRGRKGS